MNPSKPAGVAVLLLLLLLVMGSVPSHADGATASVPFVESTFILVTSDGEAIVNQTLSMAQNTTSITVPLLSAEVGDIFAVDQSGSSVSYEIGNANITVYTLGDTQVYLNYDTDSLTTKQGSVWTLDYSWNSSSTLELPYESTILSLSEVPVSVSEQNGSPVLVLGPGSWEVGYGLPIVTSQTQTTSSSRTSVTSSGPSTTSGTTSAASSSSTSSLSSSTATSSGHLPSSSSTTTAASASTTISASSSSAPGSSSGTSRWTLPLALAAVVVLAAAVTLIVVRMRGGGGVRPGSADPSTLRPDDLEMLRFIRDRGGRVVETEIRERFNAPRTTAWRQAKRLEQLGYVRVKKVGSQNQLELVRDDFE
ncbi:MAG: hypothetical protein ABSF83_09320 [Nitrososphaerales archaeon]